LGFTCTGQPPSEGRGMKMPSTINNMPFCVFCAFQCVMYACMHVSHCMYLCMCVCMHDAYMCAYIKCVCNIVTLYVQ
jgi:hypothetical protein